MREIVSRSEAIHLREQYLSEQIPLEECKPWTVQVSGTVLKIKRRPNRLGPVWGDLIEMDLDERASKRERKTWELWTMDENLMDRIESLQKGDQMTAQFVRDNGVLLKIEQKIGQER